MSGNYELSLWRVLDRVLTAKDPIVFAGRLNDKKTDIVIDNIRCGEVNIWELVDSGIVGMDIRPNYGIDGMYVCTVVPTESTMDAFIALETNWGL